MLNIALFGYGRIGKVHFYNILNNTNLNLKWVCDYNPKISFEVLDEKYRYSLEKIKITTDSNIVLNDKTIDCVIICTPTSSHYDLIKRALILGKHVFVEKPLSQSLEEIKECYNIAESNKLNLLVGYNRRFDSVIQNLKKKVDEGAIGKVNYIMTISRDFPYPTSNYLSISGGIFHDCAVHDIDYINWILNNLPISVVTTASRTKNANQNMGHFDYANIVLEYPNNIIVSLNLSRISKSYDQRCEIYGDNGELIIKDYNSRDKISFPQRYAESYKNELDYFIDLINGNKDIIIKKNDNVNNHIIAQACEKSFIENKRIKICY